MGTRRERRHRVRVTIRSLLYGLGLEEQEVRLVDLSLEGARLEHLRPVSGRQLWPLVLPEALGSVRLQGQVVWSRVAGQTLSAEGRQQLYYESGMAFRFRQPAQRAALMAALAILRAVQGG
jgi:hypothetical protein